MPGATIETTLGEHGKGGKSIDILLRLTAENEERIAGLLPLVHTLTEDTINSKEGDLIAIEIENHPRHSRERRHQRPQRGHCVQHHRHDAKAVEKIKQELLEKLPTAALQRVVVADALELLDDLRKGGA